MDPVICDLLDRYEGGRLSRRDLVTGLSALAAASAAGPALGQQALAQAAPPAFRPANIDHVSILVTDLQRSAAFYNRMFGLVPLGEDAPHKILRLGPKPADGQRGKVILSLRQEPPAGMVDHWAFRIEGFKAEDATAVLKDHGLNPANTLEFGFHVRDPDGVVVQMI
jgi:catechol 2,3-dioxygenase-like lactoylglutathione lyase family enzyme